jgi:hypothetical protein
MFAPCPSRVAFTVAAIATAVLAAMPARAHDAKSGWIYPLECCSNYDCREVADADIDEGPQGYVIKTTGEVIPMTDAKVKMSPDGEFHWCSRGGRQDGATICLFVPPRGF